MTKYIYAGPSKCGTKSVSKAFQILGYRTCDFKETFVLKQDLWYEYFCENPSDARKKEIIIEAYAEFDVFLDFPHFSMYDIVKEAYPDTKVVYWKRPFDSWYPSFMQTYSGAEAIWPKDSERDAVKENDPVSWKMFEAVDASNIASFGITVPWRKRDDGTTWASTSPPELSQENMKKWYDKHFARLEEIDNFEKFVLADLGQGWDAFCKFLGKQVPNQPWPWMNKGASMVNDLLTKNDEYLESRK